MRSIILQICFAVFIAVGAIAGNKSIDLPDTPVGRSLSEFVEAFNSGEEAQWRKFCEENYSRKPDDSAGSVERRLGFFRMLFGDLGGLIPLKIDASEELRITVLMEGLAPTGPFTFLTISYQLDSLPPHPWGLLSVRPADDPNEVLPGPDFTDSELAAFLDSWIDTLVADDEFSGTVLVARDGKPIYTRAAGEACKRYDVPNRLDTKFNLGSMNKMFTGVAVAQLAQQGKLSFSDPLIKYLPDYPDREFAEKATIHQLLTHTSGAGDYWDPLFDTSFWEIQSVPQLASLVTSQPPLFEPGERFEYSNAGPVILGLVIEAVSGMDYFDYIREHVAKPAGMINSDCFAMDTPVENLAIGYTHMNYDGSVDPDTWRNNYYMHAVKGGPAGGGFSTVEDLLAFDVALRNHTLLNAAYTDTVITGKVDMGPGFRYAYLSGDEDNNGHRVVGHNGGAPGINAVLNMYWDDGYTVAVMSNYDGAAEQIAHRIGRILTQ